LTCPYVIFDEDETGSAFLDILEIGVEVVDDVTDLMTWNDLGFKIPTAPC
jgi:hypothetical protein